MVYNKGMSVNRGIGKGRPGQKQSVEHIQKRVQSRHSTITAAGPEERRANRRRSMRRIRERVIAAYGGVCACCGEETYEFLGVDHINGGGKEHRKTETTQQLCMRLKREGWPQGEYQILCHNCNLARGFYGQCPHNVIE